jgi:SAM-dependent methyltransferase
MAALGRHLETSAYRQLYPLVAGDALLPPDLGRALEVTAALGPSDGTLLRLLALGRPVEARSVTGPGRDLVLALSNAGLVHEARGSIVTDGWVVVPALGGLLLTGTPPHYGARGAVGASGYLGPDSLRLASALPPTTAKRVLDVGCGSGVQGLLGVRSPREVVLSDVDARSLELAHLNHLLNETPFPVRFAQGDCYDPVAGEQFDLVVALPPYVPEVTGSATRSTVASGADGLGVLRKLVAGARAHLRPGGTFVARCQLLCDDDGPLLAGELRTLAPRLDGRILVSDWHPLQPYVVELATRLAAHGATPPLGELVERYTASLRGLGATGVCTALVVLARPPTRSGDGATVVTTGWSSPLRRRATTYAAAAVHVARDPGARSVATPGRAPVLLDGPSAALLAAVDGHRTLDEIVTQAWGMPRGADQRDLEDQAMLRLEHLVSLGLVTSAS